MSAAVMTVDEDIREKIKVVLHKLDKMESRVKDVETVAAVLPKLQMKLETVATRVESVAKASQPSREHSHLVVPSVAAPPPVKAFVSGASVGFLVVGAITAAWLLGFF